MAQMKVTWLQLKTVANTKPNLSIQVYDLDDHYFCFVVDGSFTLSHTLSKFNAAESADVLDLETNYIATGLANKQVDTKQIRGGTDLTLIGNIGDRLKVETSVPSFTALYQPEYFLDSVGGTVDMDVDASSAPINYSITVPVGEMWYLTSLDILMIDKGSLDPKDFGAIDDGLSNGVEISANINAINHVMFNIKNNMDLSLLFNNMNNNDGANNEDGWLDSKDKFISKKEFFPFVKLAEGDSITVKLQDDLKGLKYFRMMAHKFKGL